MTGTEEIVEAGPLTSFGEEVKAASSFVEDYMTGGRRHGVLCGNPDCRWHKEVRGGSFTYSQERKIMLCEDCFGAPPIPMSCEDRWNFTTTHFNGERIEVKGINHLRQLEKQFGVSNHAANYDKSNWDTPPSVRPQPMNPELSRMLGHAKELERTGAIRGRGSRVSGGFCE